MLRKGLVIPLLSVLLLSALGLMSLGGAHWSKDHFLADAEEMMESSLAEAQPDDLGSGFDFDKDFSPLWLAMIVQRTHLHLRRSVFAAGPMTALPGGSLPLFLLYGRLQIGDAPSIRG